MNSEADWTLTSKLLTSIRPVGSRPEQCARQHTVNRLIDTTCCSVWRWLLVVSACCRCEGRSVCWHLVQSSIMFRINLLLLTNTSTVQSSTASTFSLS